MVVFNKKKIIIVLTIIFVFVGILFVYAKAEIDSEDTIIINKNLLSLQLEMEELKSLEEESIIKDLNSFSQLSEVGFLDKSCDKYIREELYKTVDLKTFKPSYNILVTYALSEIGSKGNKFSNSVDNWSFDFLMWCNLKSGLTQSIPTVYSIEEFVNFYKSCGSFYLNTTTCYPLIGDLILIDDDLDTNIDRVNIISNVDNGVINTVGGSIWSEKEKDFIVQEVKYAFDDKKIVGVCRPDYGLNKKVENFSDFNLPFNGVDTVMYLKEDNYAYNLADKGIKLIARYINPEGRYPLDLEEVQRFSNAGIRLMMIYQVNKDDPYKGYEKGKEIGEKALTYARNLQAPKGTPIFFCCDCANRFDSFDKVAQFLIGVKEIMQDEYSIGLYGGYYVNEAMYNLGLIDAYWQCWGFSDGYLSDNADIVQYTTGRRFFDDIPYYYDANYVKNIEKVSFIVYCRKVNWL